MSFKKLLSNIDISLRSLVSKEVWGIDIGSSGIKAIKMRRNRKQAEITKCEIIPYQNSNDEMTNIRKALNELQARNKINNKKVVVAISGKFIYQLVDIPPVKASRIKEIIAYEAQHRMPFPIKEFVWDYKVVENNSEKIESMVFLMPKKTIDSVLTIFEEMELSVHGVQIPPVALYNFIRFDRPTIKNCVLVDGGAARHYIVIAYRNKLALNSLPYAGNDITKALQKEFNLLKLEAEGLKIRTRETEQSEKVLEVIKRCYKKIFFGTELFVGFYKGVVDGAEELNKMILMGNGVNFSGAESFFSQNLQHDVELLSSLQRIKVSSDLDTNLFQDNIRSFAVAMGLCIQGLGQGEINTSLLRKNKFLVT